MGFSLWHQKWDPGNPQQLLSHEQSNAGTHSYLLTSVLSLDECGLVVLYGGFRVFYLQCSVDNENFASCGKESTCNVEDLG